MLLVATTPHVLLYATPTSLPLRLFPKQIHRFQISIQSQHFPHNSVLSLARDTDNGILVSVRTSVDLRRRNESNNDLYQLKVDVGMLNTVNY